MVKEEEARANLFFLYLHKLFSANYEQFTKCLGLFGLCWGYTSPKRSVRTNIQVSNKCRMAPGSSADFCVFLCSFPSLPQFIPKYFASSHLPLFHALLPILKYHSLLFLTQALCFVSCYPVTLMPGTVSGTGISLGDLEIENTLCLTFIFM